jgi:hypothetical protein
MRCGLLALLLCGCAGPANDGDRGELTIRGDEGPLSIDRPHELFVNRAGGDIRRIVEAGCDDDACLVFIIDEEELHVIAHEPGLLGFTVKAELDDGTEVVDTTLLPFVDF